MKNKIYMKHLLGAFLLAQLSSVAFASLDFEEVSQEKQDSERSEFTHQWDKALMDTILEDQLTSVLNSSQTLVDLQGITVSWRIQER